MYSYDSLKEHNGVQVGRTIDSPILVFDYFELTEVFAALFVVLIFGVVFLSWGATAFFLAIVLGAAPYARRRNKRGIFFHWPYRRLGMELPGIVNPKGRKKYSD